MSSASPNNTMDCVSPSLPSPGEDPKEPLHEAEVDTNFPLFRSPLPRSGSSHCFPSQASSLSFGSMRNPVSHCSESSSRTSSGDSSYSSNLDDKASATSTEDIHLKSPPISEKIISRFPSHSPTCVSDAQKCVLEQQLQHMLEELQHCREAYQASLSHEKELHNNLQQARTEHNTQLHRYSALTERMAVTEKSLSQVEAALVRERKGNEKLLSEKEEEKRKVSKLQVEVATLEHRLREASAGEEKWRLQAMDLEKEIHNRYVPAAEVKRVREELLTEQHLGITQPLQQLLQNLLLAADSTETQSVVGRSRVLSASRELEDELAHTKATIAALKEYWMTFYQSLDEDTTQFMEKLVKENANLYQQLTELQRSYSVVQATLEQRLPPGESVPVAQYRAELEQLERRHATRLKKAQELLVAQTTLIREHEEAMAELMAQVEGLRAQLSELQQDREKVLGEKRSIEVSLQHSKQEVLCMMEDIKVLEQRLEEFQRNRKLEWVPREEMAEREQKIQSLMEKVREQESLRETWERKHSQTQRLLDEVTRQSEAQQRELASGKESLTAQRTRWEEDTARLQEEYNASLQRAEKRFVERVAELEKEIKVFRDREGEELASLQRLQAEVAESQVQVRSLECSRCLLEEDRDTLRQQLEEVRSQQLTPLEAERASLEIKLRQLQSEKEDTTERAAALAQQLSEERKMRATEEEKLRGSHGRALKELEIAEAARNELQQHLGKALCRIKDLEIEMDGDRTSGLDRGSLLKENQRLQALLKAQAEESERSHTTLEQQRAHMQLQEELQVQVKELQRQLSCLPPLKEALCALETECQAAKAEVRSLQQERDGMALRLESIFKRGKEDQLMEESFNKVLRDACESTISRERSLIDLKLKEESHVVSREGGRKSKDSGAFVSEKVEKNHSSSVTPSTTTQREAFSMSSRRQSFRSAPGYHYSAAARAALLFPGSSTSSSLHRSSSRGNLLTPSSRTINTSSSSSLGAVTAPEITKKYSANIHEKPETARENVIIPELNKEEVTMTASASNASHLATSSFISVTPCNETENTLRSRETQETGMDVLPVDHNQKTVSLEDFEDVKLDLCSSAPDESPNPLSNVSTVRSCSVEGCVQTPRQSSVDLPSLSVSPMRRQWKG